MPIFTRKKSSTPPHAPSEAPPSPRPRPSTDSAEAQRARSAQSSPEKKSRTSFVRDRDQREKEKTPKSPRASSSFAFRRRSSDSRNSHPLNLPPEELRRLSALRSANMASPKEEISEPMQESTPAPQQAPGAFPQPNGNGDHTEESGPAPPPHNIKSASNSPPSNSPPQSPVVDAQQCKEAGNKFFKAQQYDKAIEEYTKGGSPQAERVQISTLS
jgi:DnaJ family protein C protein 7